MAWYRAEVEREKVAAEERKTRQEQRVEADNLLAMEVEVALAAEAKAAELKHIDEDRVAAQKAQEEEDKAEVAAS